MSNLMKKIALVAVILFTATAACHAAVPEIDPSSTSAGLVLLGGIALMPWPLRKISLFVCNGFEAPQLHPYPYRAGSAFYGRAAFSCSPARHLPAG